MSVELEKEVKYINNQFSAVQFSRSVMSDSLRPHESQHARPPCPSPTPGVHSNSCPSSWWCHPAISSSVIPFSSCPNPPSIRVFSNESTLRMRWPKYWSFSFTISPSKEHPGLISFRMDWLDLLAVQGTLKSLLQLACCDLWGRKESDMTEWLNWTDAPCISLFPWKQHQPKIFS